MILMDVVAFSLIVGIWAIVLDLLQHDGHIFSFLPLFRLRLLKKLGVIENSILFNTLERWMGGCYLCHSGLVALVAYPFVLGVNLFWPVAIVLAIFAAYKLA